MAKMNIDVDNGEFVLWSGFLFKIYFLDDEKQRKLKSFYLTDENLYFSYSRKVFDVNEFYIPLEDMEHIESRCLGNGVTLLTIEVEDEIYRFLFTENSNLHSGELAKFIAVEQLAQNYLALKKQIIE